MVTPSTSRTERYCDLTCMAALGGLPYPPGSFVLVSRPPDWDEIWVAGYTDKQDIIGRTTASDGSDWIWCLVRPAPNAINVPQTVNGNRRLPAGVPQNAANWMCVPPECNDQWDPEAVEVVALTQEAVRLANQIKDNPGTFPINQAGVAGPLIPLVGGNMGPGGLVVAAAAGGQGAGGLGLPGEGGQSPSSAELKALESAVAQLQQLALSPQRKKDKGRKSKKEKKHDKKSKKKKKKKKSKRSSSSGSSSTSSRSRSRSSSSSSSTSSGKTKPLRWKENGRDRKVTYGNLAAVDQLKLKKRGDLLAFAAKSPGIDSSLPCGGVCPFEQRNSESVQSAPGGKCSVVGPSIQWIDGIEGSERSPHVVRNPGSREPSGNCKGLGHLGAAHSGNPIGKGEEWIVGKGRELGAGRWRPAPCWH